MIDMSQQYLSTINASSIFVCMQAWSCLKHLGISKVSRDCMRISQIYLTPDFPLTSGLQIFSSIMNLKSAAEKQQSPRDHGIS